MSAHDGATLDGGAAAWEIDPVVWIGVVLAGAAYLAACGWIARRDGTAIPFWQRACFFAGLATLFVALQSPLATLADTLFSVHMVQHLLLLLIVPPLLLLGIPPSLAASAVHPPLMRRIERTLRWPVVAWLLGVGAMWVWHAPALFDAALLHDGIHDSEHLCFLVTATIFWWPVVAPLAASRLATLGGILYLFSAAVAGAVLGIILTFAPPGLYPAYARVANPFGLSRATDQQLGGLLMWVPGGLIYLCAIIGIVARWYNMADDDIPIPAAPAAREGDSIRPPRTAGSPSLPERVS